MKDIHKFIFDSVPCVILLLDENKNVFEVNEKINTLGYKIEEIINKNIFDLPLFISKKTLEKLFKEKKLDIEILTEYGEKMMVSAELLEIEDEKVRYILILRDITKEGILEKKAKEDEDLLKEWLKLAEKSVAGVYIYDENLNFLYVNPAFCEIVGYSRDEIIGKKKALDFVYEEDREKVRELIEKRFKGLIDTTNFYFRFKTREGKIKHCNAIGRATKYKGKKVIMGTVLDITDRVEYENKLREGHKLLESTLDGTIYAFSKIVEAKDPYTAGHQLNVSKLSELIAKEIGFKENEIKELIWAGLLHDIGKITVPSEILVLPRKLTSIEFSIVKTHPIVAYNILKVIPTFEKLAKIVLQHHERLDGSGYPQGINGEKILKEARIISVCDVFEAMVSHRPYRPALPVEKAIEEIYKGRGLKFDTEVVDICIDLFKKGIFKLQE